MNQALSSKSFSSWIKGHKLWRLHTDRIDGSVLTRWAPQRFNKNLVSLQYRLPGAEVPLAFGLWGTVLGSRPLVFVIKRPVLLTGSDKWYHTTGERATVRARSVMSLNSSWYIYIHRIQGYAAVTDFQHSKHLRRLLCIWERAITQLSVFSPSSIFQKSLIHMSELTKIKLCSS